MRGLIALLGCLVAWAALGQTSVTGPAIAISSPPACGPSLGTICPAQSENRIINGDFVIDQYNEFGSVTPSGNGYVIDRWRLGETVGSSLTTQGLTTSPPAGLSNYLTITTAIATTPSAAQSFNIAQRIEGINVADLQFGTANAKSIVVSFWAQSSLTGIFTLALKNSAGNRTYLAPYNIAVANTWQFFSLIVPGDTTGTWLYAKNTQGLLVLFDLGAGSNFQGTGNSWQAAGLQEITGADQLVATLGATLSIANVRLYASTYALPYSPRPYGLELELAQRYYRKSFPAGTVPAQSAGVTGSLNVKNPIALGDPSLYVSFAPQMMAAPTIVTFNPSASNANWRDVTAAADVTVSVDPATAKGPSGVLLATSGTVTTLGDVLAIHYTAQSEL